MKRLLTFGVSCTALAAALAAGTFGPAPAATAGLAYDSVTKIKMGGDASSPQPGTFAADFDVASQPPKKHGGMFGSVLNAAMGAQSMFQSGTAEHHYLAGSKERTDEIAMQTATITDCAARTITTLDLAKKTYRVTSMDQPTKYTAPEGPSGTPGPRPTDDGTKVSVVLKTTSLGPKQLGPDPTNGYNLDMKMTSTKPNGDSQTSEMSMTSYYSNYPNPQLVCPRYVASGASQGMMAPMAAYSAVSKALESNGKDARFKVSASGPPIPSGKLSLFDVMIPKGQAGSGPSGGFTMVMERGNVRGINDGDPAFGIPAGFTKE